MRRRKRKVQNAKILWIEGKSAGPSSFVSVLREKGYKIDTVHTGKSALNILETKKHDLAIVDAVSLRTSGKRICQGLRDQVNGLPIILISNPKRPISQGFKANVVLSMPFTIRKLENRIIPMLPGDGENTIQAGPIKLDLERNYVRVRGRKAHLTPRLAYLLQILMDKPGEVLDREGLFKKVWRTQYTGDTRTLDVHISWLRAAIEEDPRKPRYLKTIRGVGYRLDV